MSTVTESAATVQTDRLLWQGAVQRVSALAHAKLPETLHGRLERATGLVLSGAVWIEEDGHTCHVRASNGQGWYAVNGHCRCTDHTKAQGGLCKHRLGDPDNPPSDHVAGHRCPFRPNHLHEIIEVRLDTPAPRQYGRQQPALQSLCPKARGL